MTHMALHELIWSRYVLPCLRVAPRSKNSRETAMRKCLIIVCITLASEMLGGCAALGGPFCAPYCQANHRSSSSLVDFLYANGQAPPAANTVPELHVPLRVGLAFLPSRGGAASGPDEALKEQLLERIRQRFSDRKFVSEIVV